MVLLERLLLTDYVGRGVGKSTNCRGVGGGSGKGSSCSVSGGSRGSDSMSYDSGSIPSTYNTSFRASGLLYSSHFLRGS